MKFIGGIILFLLVAGFSLGPALVGCDSDSKNNNDILMMALALSGYAPNNIYIYNGGTHNGNFLNRTTADALCQTAASGFTALSGKRFKKAFISFSGFDQIKDLVPAQYAALSVYGLKSDGTETLLKDTWNNLWTSSGIGDTLQNTVGIVDGWWSGSAADGSFSGISSSCREWTCNTNPCDPAASGIAGRFNNNSAAMWLTGVGYACDATLIHFLCVAY
jgi:hypothetical protein